MKEEVTWQQISPLQFANLNFLDGISPDLAWLVAFREWLDLASQRCAQARLVIAQPPPESFPVRIEPC